MKSNAWLFRVALFVSMIALFFITPSFAQHMGGDHHGIPNPQQQLQSHIQQMGDMMQHMQQMLTRIQDMNRHINEMMQGQHGMMQNMEGAVQTNAGNYVYTSTGTLTKIPKSPVTKNPVTGSHGRRRRIFSFKNDNFIDIL